MNKRKKDKMIFDAGVCSSRVVASGHMCGGCPMSVYCNVSEKFNARRAHEWKEWEKEYFGIRSLEG